MKSVLSGVLYLVLLFSAGVVSGANQPIGRMVQPIPNEYIVELQQPISGTVREVADTLASFYGGTVVTTYENTIKGFWIRINPQAAEALNSNPLVKWMEENGQGFLAATQGPPLPDHNPSTPANLWYLDRTDQPTPTAPRTNNQFSYCSTGVGVRVYVVDTGVLPNHDELVGRVDSAPSLVALLDAQAPPSLGRQCWDDPFGTPDVSPSAAHGTAVASVIAGTTFGVAKEATIVDARVVTCAGVVNAARVSKA